MRVLFISSSSGSRGGGELYLLFLAEALLSQGVDVGLWCSSHSRMNELADSFSRLGRVFRSEYKNTYDYVIRSIIYLFPKKMVGIKSAIDDFKPSIIHFNKQNIEDGLDLLETLDKLEVSYVTTIHITQTQKKLNALLGGLRDSISLKILQRAKSLKWITISSNRFTDFTNFLIDGKERIVMVPNGVKMVDTVEIKLREETRERLNIQENYFIAISIGRLEHQKDPLKFIDWAEQCLRLNPKSNFFWIGDGSLRNEFEEKITRLKLNDHIKCLGWQRDVKPFYAMADIYLHTARYEGLPFSLLEAMSWRLPCLVAEELYNDLSFPEKVIYKGIGEMKSLVNNGVLRMEAGNRAQNYVKENFSLETISRTYLSIYKSII